jgi:putative ubiquitin-RnfH superfamily antitoxin RatB of RatAB toxin-antitoxin module
MRVTVVFATPRIQDVVGVELPEGATIADALAQSGFVTHYGLDPAALVVAVFGRRARADAPLADGDRVELTRNLLADPKAARARRALEKPVARPKRPPRRRQGS